MSARDNVLAWERSTRPLAVRPELVRLTGGFDTAVMLAQILYWFGEDKYGRCRASIVRDGEAWVAKSVHEWADELGAVRMNGQPRDDLIRGMIGRLERGGFIVKGLWKFDGAPTLHVRPVWEALEILTNPKSIPDAAGNPITTAPDIHSRPRRESLTEITAETTSEIPVGGSTNGVPPADASADNRRAARYALATTIAEAVGDTAGSAVKADGTVKANYGKIVGQLCHEAGGYAGAFMAWDAFRNSIKPAEWEKFGSITVVGSRFGRWAQNGGAPTLAAIRAECERDEARAAARSGGAS